MKPGWLGSGLAAAAGALRVRSLRRPHRLKGRFVLITGGSAATGFNRALPRGGEAPGTGSHKGHDSESFATRSPLTFFTRSAELRQNQH